MFVQELECPFAVDAVPALKEFDRHSIRHSKLCVEAVFLQHRGHSNCGLAAVAQAVKRNAVAIDKRQRIEPGQDLIMLGDDEAEQRASNRVRLPIQPALLVFPSIQCLDGRRCFLRQSSQQCERRPTAGRHGNELVVAVRIPGFEVKLERFAASLNVP